eukprot:gene31258-40627_t
MVESWEDDGFEVPALPSVSGVSVLSVPELPLGLSSSAGNDLILLLGGHPYEGQYKGNSSNSFGLSRQRLADDSRVYFVDSGFGSLVDTDVVPAHPRWFCVDFNDSNAMLQSFFGLEGKFEQIYFDTSTVKFFNIWSFPILHILLKPGGTIAWGRDTGVPLLDYFLALRLPLQEFHRQMEEVFCLEEGKVDDISLSMRKDILETNPNRGKGGLLVLKKSISKTPLIDIETAMSLSTAGTELTETEFNRIPPSLALQIMDDMFSRDHREVALHRPRFYQAYNQWLKRDRDLRDKCWLDWHQKQKS